MRGKIKIIAEAGVNHNGSLENAKKLVDAAVAAGADYVKFQTFKADKIVSKHAVKAAYQQQHTVANESQYDMLKKLELDEDAHLMLTDYCKGKIEFLSTAFDLSSIDLLKKLGITLGKIPSGEITNLPYLRKVAAAFPEIILSTGMTTMSEISAALEALICAGADRENITILHCNTQYPTPMEDVNLHAMLTIQKAFNVKIGYSDHTLGIEVPIAAAALGATVIEKHFTLDKTWPGPDHKASLDPGELAAMVSAIRNIEMALGSENKQPTPSEIENLVIARKSIVASKTILKGEIFSEANLSVKRPGNGISPMEWDNIIGKTAFKNFQEDELISI